MRFRILVRDQFTCQYCGRRAPDVALEVDHRRPRSAGGGNDHSNLVTACFDCNQGKKHFFDTTGSHDFPSVQEDYLYAIHRIADLWEQLDEATGVRR